jgi:hypothetical protein
VQVTEIMGDTRELLMDLDPPYGILSCNWRQALTAIFDHTSNTEQEGSDDRYHTSEYVLLCAPRNLTIINRHLLEDVPRCVLELRHVLRFGLTYVPISYSLRSSIKTVASQQFNAFLQILLCSTLNL